MLAITKPADVKTLGTLDSKLTLGAKSTRDAAGFHMTMQLTGEYGTLASLQGTSACQPGAIALPLSLTLVDAALKIKLVDCALDMEPGFRGTLTLNFAERNAREVDADMALGLLSRTISMRWIERQEQIEHFAARLGSGYTLGTFNPVLVEMWRNEQCAAAKKAFQVRIFKDVSGEAVYDTTVALDNSGTDINGTAVAAGLTGSNLTKAIAQRIEQGVEYASQYVIQVLVRELWRTAPTFTGACNTVLPAGIPTNHRPLFGSDDLTGITWARLTDNVEQPGATQFMRTVVYMGLPATMMPYPVPQEWGATPYDGMLYKTAT